MTTTYTSMRYVELRAAWSVTLCTCDAIERALQAERDPDTYALNKHMRDCHYRLTLSRLERK